jgi:hypothetical protein
VDPFTIRDGVLELDEGRGRADGPRAVDPRAGLIRFADSQRDVPIGALRAVAVVYVERDVRVRVGRSQTEMVRRMVHEVVLVPRGGRGDMVALLDALETGTRPPSGFSIFGAAATVGDGSLHLCRVGSALQGRRTAKAVARMAGLPMLELYGERPVYRPKGQLDLSLRDALARDGAREDPGPAPPGLAVSRSEQALALTVVTTRPPVAVWLLLAGVSALISLALFVTAPPLGVVGLVLAATVAVMALRRRAPPSSRLVVGRDTIDWKSGELDESFPTGTLEMTRIVDSTLVLIFHDDEIRCPLPTEQAARWARLAVGHELAHRTAAPYR